MRSSGLCRRKRARAGFSLLEVLLSLAILVGAIAVLGELMSMGMNNAEEAHERSRAVVMAEGIMDQVLSGLIAAQATNQADVPTELLTPDEAEMNDRWVYDLELSPTTDVGMTALIVTVRQSSSERFDSTATEFTLTRWMIDPVVMDEMAAAEEAAEMAETSGGIQ
ncbi:MAG: hypothetical protein MPJ50_17375 [Pirellulales bacterium]|nr:hypothetical protein [Pirellulales bacterium]